MGPAERLKEIPERPGVYLFKDAEGKVLYVGKAASLRKRVSSYWQPGRPHSARLTQLVRQVEDVEWITTGSEAEALLYEAGLIKEKRPKYNVSFRDDKSYPYLKVTHEEAFPRLFIGRGAGEPGIRAIGPFAHAGLLKQAFRAIRRVIPFRTCLHLPRRACLDFHLRLCQAPCEGRISPEAYQETISKVFRLMEGRKAEVLEELRAKMTEASNQRRYEEAAILRDQIAGLGELSARPRRFIPAQALGDLQSVLQLPRPPRRIEGFDVSNLFGREAVGAMVTFLDGRPFKDGYQRFKIRAVAGIDDYAMMREIVRRRYEPKTPSPIPDLIVIDGGRGHLNAALEVLKELQIPLPAAGIAKEYEQLFLPGREQPILLPPHSRALQLVQRVRDEAHRFAIGYHRLLRGKLALASALDEIPGVGPRRRQDLIVRFGSVEGIRRATLEELTQVRGISPMLAERLRRQLKKLS